MVRCNSNFFFLVVVITSVPLFSGCRNANDQIKQDAIIQGTESANANAKAQREREEQIGTEIERTLTSRQRLYQGLAGTYRGVYYSAAGFKIDYSLSLLPTVSPYKGKRVRTEAEVVAELTKLNFKVAFRAQSTDSVAFGCAFSSIEPDPSDGRILLASESCPYSIQLWLTDKSTAKMPKNIDNMSAQLADQLLEGKLDSINHLFFEGISNLNGLVFRTSLKKSAKSTPSLGL